MASTFTPRLNLEKPGLGDLNFHTAHNSNFDLLDAAYGSGLVDSDDLPETYLLTDTFNGTTGVTVTLPKTVGSVAEYAVAITPTTRAASIGDIEVERATTNFVVKSHGNNTSDDFMAVVMYVGDITKYGGAIYRKWYVSTDAGITDHSDDTDAGSLAWVIDQIGANPAFIELPGNKTYVIDDDVDATANTNHIQIIFQPGALIQPAATKRMKVFSPEHLRAAPRQQIFDMTNNSTNPVEFAIGGTAWVDWMEENTTPAVAATEMAHAINVLETALHETKGGGTIKFNTGEYMIGVQISKSPLVSWQGAGGGRSSTVDTAYSWSAGDSYATVLVANADFSTGVGNYMIDFNNTSSTNAWVRNRFVKSIHFIGNLTSGPYASNLFEINYIRQFIFEDCYFQQWNIAFNCVNSGELYFNRVFGNACTICLNGINLSDTWIDNCHFGGGESVAGNAAVFYSCGSTFITKSRFQVTENGGAGALFWNSFGTKITSCIADQNEGGGFVFKNCAKVTINDPNIFDNGTTGSKQAGVQIATKSFDVTGSGLTPGDTYLTIGAHFWYNGNSPVEVVSTGNLPDPLVANTRYWVSRKNSTAIHFSLSRADAAAGTTIDLTDAGTGTVTVQGVSEDIKVMGGAIYDRNFNQSDEVQSKGVLFAHTQSATSVDGIIRGIDVFGVNMNDVDYPIRFPEEVEANELVISDIRPTAETITAAGALVPWGVSLLDSTGGAMAITLGDGTCYGQRKTIIMTVDGGDATLTVANHDLGDGKTYVFANVDETVVLEWTGTEWIEIAETIA